MRTSGDMKHRTSRAEGFRGQDMPNCPPRTHKASVVSHCFSWQGALCRLCEQQCPQGAIRFTPAFGGFALPEIDSAACDGCGACVTVCPTKAIIIE